MGIRVKNDDDDVNVDTTPQIFAKFSNMWHFSVKNL